MFTIRTTAVAGLLLGAAVATPVAAASIIGDEFAAEVTSGVGDFSEVTGVGVADGLPAFDIAESGVISLEVNWFDEDSVDIAFFGTLDSNDDVSTILSDLNFMSGSLAVDIAGVSFNRSASNIDTFCGDEDIGQPPCDVFVEPDLSWTPTSFTALFSSFDPRLVGDGPRLRYDVSFSPEISPVPVPAAAWLFGTALIGLVGFSKRRKAA